MNDQNNRSLKKSHQSEFKDSDIDKQKGEHKEVDAIKTGSKKQNRYHDKPFDEQMFESFNDVKEDEMKKDEGAD